MSHLKHWIALGTVITLSFAVLGYYGYEIYVQAPPIPEQVVDSEGDVLFTGQEIRDGLNVWQSMGGQQMGSVWGHGAYVAPDWSADWMHREFTALLEMWAQRDFSRPYGDLDPEQQAQLQARLKSEIRTNTHDPKTGVVTVSRDRADAIAATASHYTSLFGADPELDELREAYAIPAAALKDEDRKHQISAFFFWAAWSCSTHRPDNTITYTHNWPPEPLIDNQLTGQLILWSVLSVVLLLAGVGALAWYLASKSRHDPDDGRIPWTDPLLNLSPTPSMRATLKYFWVVTGLFLLQVVFGIVTAHYGVEGDGFYGFPLAEWVPYSLSRTWHIQLGIFWIATAWLGTGLFIAPAVSGYEPPFQRLGVHILFLALLLIVAGSMFGQFLGVHQHLGLAQNFYFGHQGLEYVDLGRFWQWFLFIGLFIWLGLVGRALAPAFRNPNENRHLLSLFLIASVAIAVFYGAGLAWGRQTHYSIIEYWRWWVVHLWVEGFFEVFATVAIAFLFTRLGLVRAATAGRAVLFSSVLFLAGGIIGTFHHLYFTGTTTGVMALGAVFSAMEVVPLVLIGFEAYENLALAKSRPWVSTYRWPIYFFVGVAFWNLVGAGLFGFMINPPAALYYMQGLNTTPVHAHTALFGVYGLLGLGLSLFCLKGLDIKATWKTGVLAFSFWAMNIGLALMVLLSLLPVGVLQILASIDTGMWYARSAEFLQTPLMENLRWLRVVGDTIFAVGALSYAWFVVGLKTGWSLSKHEATSPSTIPAAEAPAR